MVGRGVLDLLASLTTIDGLSLIACTMFGLALGVDYSLLMVSRFRQELADGATPIAAAHRTRQTAGNTTVLRRLHTAAGDPRLGRPAGRLIAGLIGAGPGGSNGR